MPSWCSNKLVVEGDPTDAWAFMKRVQSEERDEDSGKRFPIGFERHVPPPDGPFETKPDPDGVFPDWYLWRRENRGTKWNAMYPRRSGSAKSGRLLYSFLTAYAPPLPWLEVVVREHPELSFELRFQEEFDIFSGCMRLRCRP